MQTCSQFLWNSTHNWLCYINCEKFTVTKQYATDFLSYVSSEQFCKFLLILQYVQQFEMESNGYFYVYIIWGTSYPRELEVCELIGIVLWIIIKDFCKC